MEFSAQMNYWAIVPAAGCGLRMNGPKAKQYLKLAGKTIIEHALMPLLENSNIKKVVVVVADGDAQWRNLPISQSNKIITVIGGKERCHSVYNGLRALQSYAEAEDWVLIHDAARPLLKKHDLDHLMQTLAEHPVGGLLGAPIHSTIKRVSHHNTVLETIPRRHLWHAFTPQMFRYGILQQALVQTLPDNPTSDSAKAVEQLGYAPKMVEGDGDNIKVTHAADLIWVEQMLEVRT